MDTLSGSSCFFFFLSLFPHRKTYENSVTPRLLCEREAKRTKPKQPKINQRLSLVHPTVRRVTVPSRSGDMYPMYSSPKARTRNATPKCGGGKEVVSRAYLA